MRGCSWSTSWQLDFYTEAQFMGAAVSSGVFITAACMTPQVSLRVGVLTGFVQGYPGTRFKYAPRLNLEQCQRRPRKDLG